jgi:hypothetical protein
MRKVAKENVGWRGVAREERFRNSALRYVILQVMLGVVIKGKTKLITTSIIITTRRTQTI